MVRLREIQRTAAFAWFPGSAAPAIVTGTKAGAVDADFSNDTTLELWELGLDSTEPAKELEPAGSVSTDSRFHDIAWSQPTGSHKGGVIAGALESGALEVWDAEKLRASPGESQLSKTTKHSGAAKAVQFNHFRDELLATAGAKGELYIWDLNNIANPFRLGASAARADDYECLDWNKGEKVPHILATGSNGGFVTVWDVRGKKENLTLNNSGRKAVSAVSWDPNAATRLITAVPDDQNPLILVWDLRNSNAPERTLTGHELGVLSLDWCRQDSDLLLSCGKDNRTICWDPHSGQAYGEYPVVTNWTFQTRWNPHNPNLFATASFEGKIAVHSVQNTNAASVDAQTTAGQAADAEDFFARTDTRPQGPSFSLPAAPKWQKRPVGASFGFGGKLIRFKIDPGSKKTQIVLDTFAVDSSIPEAAKKFEEALQTGDVASFCEKKIEETSNEEEKADWHVIKTLHAGKSRKELSAYLGLSGTADEPATNGDNKADTKELKDDSDFFGGASDDSDNFLANLAATKGAKTNQPFSLHTKTESQADKDVTSAIILGDFDKALDICLADKRLSDSFMIAICGGQKCIDKVQRAYLKEKAEGPTYLRLLASIVGKNLWDVVHNADLEDWKEVVATLCTFADDSEFSDLCEALGDRLEEAISEGTEKTTYRRDASFCYLAGSKLEKVVKIWTSELHEREKEGLRSGGDDDSGFSVHARALQAFIEKVTVFRQVTNFQDPYHSATSDWKLGPLYTKYTEYADILASHGQLEAAQKYLDLLPPKYPLADVAQERIRRATAKPGAQAATKQQTTTNARPGQRAATSAYSVPSPAAAAPAATPYAPAVGATPVQPAGPYAPLGGQQTGAYPQPQTVYQQPQQGGYLPPGQGVYGQPAQYGAGGPYGGGYPSSQGGIPPPPTRSAASPSGPPAPPKAKGDWNDMPDNFFKAPSTASRRGTPAAAAVASPFPNGPNNFATPPPPGAAGYQGPKPAALPPPPKAGQSASQLSSPPTSAGLPVRPPSSAANNYVPAAPPSSNYTPQPVLGSTLPNPGAPPAMRGASPFNAPPGGGPPSNRYAPAPGAAPSIPGPGAPQPPRNVPPPPNPYARAPSATYAARPPSTTQPPIAPPPQSGPPPSAGTPPSAAGPPPRGPPQGPPRGGPPRQDTPGGPPPPAKATPPASSKHPPGDRSHIPASSQPIFHILSTDMARVKSKAPAAYTTQVNDTEKRLSLFFDHLNNQDLANPASIGQVGDIAQALEARDYARAQETLTTLIAEASTEDSNWIVGIKRLIAMSRATPV